MSEGEGEEGFSCIFDIFTFDQSRVNRFTEFQPIVGDCQKNQTNEFSPEILLIDRSDGS
jgi:hypothetical protein